MRDVIFESVPDGATVEIIGPTIDDIFNESGTGIICSGRELLTLLNQKRISANWWTKWNRNQRFLIADYAVRNFAIMVTHVREEWLPWVDVQAVPCLSAAMVNMCRFDYDPPHTGMEKCYWKHITNDPDEHKTVNEEMMFHLPCYLVHVAKIRHTINAIQIDKADSMSSWLFFYGKYSNVRVGDGNMPCNSDVEVYAPINMSCAGVGFGEYHGRWHINEDCSVIKL